jgi:hypothetical protein
VKAGNDRSIEEWRAPFNGEMKEEATRRLFLFIGGGRVNTLKFWKF